MPLQPSPTLLSCCLSGGRFLPPSPSPHCWYTELREGCSNLPPLKVFVQSWGIWKQAQGKQPFLFAMHSTCFLSGCKEPEQTFLAALHHVRGHIRSFFHLIKNSSVWGGVEGGWGAEGSGGKSRQGKWARQICL